MPGRLIHQFRRINDVERPDSHLSKSSFYSNIRAVGSFTLQMPLVPECQRESLCTSTELQRILTLSPVYKLSMNGTPIELLYGRYHARAAAWDIAVFLKYSIAVLVNDKVIVIALFWLEQRMRISALAVSAPQVCHSFCL